MGISLLRSQIARNSPLPCAPNSGGPVLARPRVFAATGNRPPPEKSSFWTNPLGRFGAAVLERRSPGSFRRPTIPGQIMSLRQRGLRYDDRFRHDREQFDRPVLRNGDRRLSLRAAYSIRQLAKPRRRRGRLPRQEAGSDWPFRPARLPHSRPVAMGSLDGTSDDHAAKPRSLLARPAPKNGVVRKRVIALTAALCSRRRIERRKR